jgi:hypothetical protein
MAVFGSPDDAVDHIARLAGDLDAGRVIYWFDPGGLFAPTDVTASMRAVAAAADLRRLEPVTT